MRPSADSTSTIAPYATHSTASRESARGLAHSKTLRVAREHSEFAPASWSAAGSEAPRRFGTRRANRQFNRHLPPESAVAALLCRRSPRPFARRYALEIRAHLRPRIKALSESVSIRVHLWLNYLA